MNTYYFQNCMIRILEKRSKIKLDFSRKDKTPSFLEPVVITNLDGNWGFNSGEFQQQVKE